jgi:hypothetical protein
MEHTTQTPLDDVPPGARPCAQHVVFVGERRSRRAILMGVRWEDGRLAARTLQEALRASGLDPARQIYLNLYRDGDPLAIDQAALTKVRTLAGEGLPIVGMGRLVQRALERASVPHLRLVHPAARGAIRARAAYQAHVAAVLGRAA